VQAYNRLWRQVAGSRVGGESTRNGSARTFWDQEQRKHRVEVSSFEEMRPVGDGTQAMTRRRVLQVRELIASANDGSLEVRADSFVLGEESGSLQLLDRLLTRGFENAPTTYRTRYTREGNGIKECELYRPAVRRSPTALRRESESETNRRFAVVRTLLGGIG
jgi:hypothetical protein